MKSRKINLHRNFNKRIYNKSSQATSIFKSNFLTNLNIKLADKILTPINLNSLNQKKFNSSKSNINKSLEAKIKVWKKIKRPFTCVSMNESNTMNKIQINSHVLFNQNNFPEKAIISKTEKTINGKNYKIEISLNDTYFTIVVLDTHHSKYLIRISLQECLLI